jgi:enoyl-CoA hydratase/carnithine racemase
MFETLEVSTDGPIGRLTLNRPDRLNALSVQMLEELAAAARWFDTQQDVKAVVVTGNGRAFCAGADLTGFPAVDEAALRPAADAGRVMADALEQMRAISIVGIAGWCVGGGLVLAAACDLRVASSATRFSIPEVDLGIPLAWGGIPRLVREIGPALTKELVITCREFDAPEALSAGFLNFVVEPQSLESKLMELAQSVAEKPSIPVFATKRHVNAVTAQMVGMDRAWSDADSLIAALVDAECEQHRQAYMSARLS